MAELADAPDSGSGGGNAVRVQIPPSAFFDPYCNFKVHLLSLNMTLFFGILLSALIGYVLSGLILFLMPIMAVLFLIYVFTKPAFARYIEEKREKRKLKKLLNERLRYIP